jgi:hypothetical protein
MNLEALQHSVDQKVPGAACSGTVLLSESSAVLTEHHRQRHLDTEQRLSVLISHDAKQTQYFKETNNDLDHNQVHNNMVQPRAVAEQQQQHSGAGAAQHNRAAAAAAAQWCYFVATPSTNRFEVLAHTHEHTQLACCPSQCKQLNRVQKSDVH